MAKYEFLILLVQPSFPQAIHVGLAARAANRSEQRLLGTTAQNAMTWYL